MEFRKRVYNSDFSEIDKLIKEVDIGISESEVIGNLMLCIRDLRKIIDEQNKEINEIYKILNEHEKGLG